MPPGAPPQLESGHWPARGTWLLALALGLALVGTPSPSLARSPGAQGSSTAPGGAAKPKPKPKPKGRQRSSSYHYRHKVLPGEVLGEIARRYQVRVASIQRWNDLPGSIIRAGEVLHIYTPHPVRARREILHQVRRGESLTAIARKYDSDPKTVARLNGIRDPRRLRAGQTLKIVVEGPEVPSDSRGTPQQGRLINGEQLPAGPGYRIGNRNKAWGTNQLVTRLINAFRKMWKLYPRHSIAVGDISRKGGGLFPPHVSHQNGRDVDIAFYVRGKKQVDHFVRVTPRTLDATRTWDLFEILIEGGGVQYAFVDYGLQEPLYAAARKKGWSERKLRDVFQYPRGRGAGALIMHEPGHADHVHLRFED